MLRPAPPLMGTSPYRPSIPRNGTNRMIDSHDGNEQGWHAGRDALVGAAVSAAVLAAYVWLVGAEAVGRALGQLTPAWLGALALAGCLPIVLWGASLWNVFGVVHRRIPAWKAVGLFVASVFMNSVTPFGQIGGDPPSAFLVAREGGSSFESGLAAVSSVNALNRVAAVCLGIVAVAFYTSRIAVVESLQEGVVVIVVLGLLGLAVLGLAWIHRHTVAAVVARALTRLGSRVPVVEPSYESIYERIDGFVVALERLASRPRVLVAAFLLGVAGQLLVAGVLWLALVVLGVVVPVPLVLLIVPAAKLAGVTPLPGGSGSAEALVSGLLVIGADVSIAVAAAASLLYRVVAFWLPTVVGGLVTVAFLLQPSAE